MKVYRTSIMNQMDMTMYMCSMCMCFGANFSDKPSGQSYNIMRAADRIRVAYIGIYRGSFIGGFLILLSIRRRNTIRL